MTGIITDIRFIIAAGIALTIIITVFCVCLYCLFPFYFLSSFIIYIEYLIILAICQGKEKLLSSHTQA